MLGFVRQTTLDAANATIEAAAKDLRSAVAARDELARGLKRASADLEDLRTLFMRSEQERDNALRDLASVRKDVAAAAAELNARDRVLAAKQNELDRSTADLRIATATIETVRLSGKKRAEELVELLEESRSAGARLEAALEEERVANDRLRADLADCRARLNAAGDAAHTAQQRADEIEAAQRRHRTDHEEQLATALEAARATERVLRNELAGLKGA